jgi:hypothetical protein
MHKGEYLKDASKHVEYYRQFATPQVIKAVLKNFSPFLQDDTYPFSKSDPHLWDRLAYVVPNGLFRLVGDFPSLQGKVYTLKVAAHLIQKEGLLARSAPW